MQQLAKRSQKNRHSHRSDPTAQYFFQGENVSIPAEPSYLGSQKRASGSSIASALASGIAALTLSCRRLGDNEKKVDRIKTVRTVFDRMTLPDQDEYEALEGIQRRGFRRRRRVAVGKEQFWEQGGLLLLALIWIPLYLDRQRIYVHSLLYKQPKAINFHEDSIS